MLGLVAGVDLDSSDRHCLSATLSEQLQFCCNVFCLFVFLRVPSLFRSNQCSISVLLTLPPISFSTRPLPPNSKHKKRLSLPKFPQQSPVRVVNPPPTTTAAVFPPPREQLGLDVGVLQHRDPRVGGVVVQSLLLLLFFVGHLYRWEDGG